MLLIYGKHDDIYFNGAADKAYGNETHKKYRVRYCNNILQKKLEFKFMNYI